VNEKKPKKGESNMKFFSLKTLSILSLVLASAVIFSGNVLALNWTYSDDPTGDASGGDLYEVHRMGYAYDENNLYFNMRTAFPQSGDGHGIEAGDLYINVGGSHNAGTGDVYGLALTSHEGDMNNDVADVSWVTMAHADDGYDWSAVEQGHLYSDAVFSTGVYENYNGANDISEDGGNDPFGGWNNIPVHIAEFGNDLGYQGDVTWEKVDGLYEVNAVISLAALDLSAGGDFELWWSMECGNELAMISGSVAPQKPTATPEPGTLLLLSGGLFAIIGIIRKRQA
jgi:hypothetical protein